MEVAPHAGAWIETSFGVKAMHANCLSHPTRVRGLKLYHTGGMTTDNDVAPHAGAWIETRWRTPSAPLRTASHPTRVRGLKLPNRRWKISPNKSHPTRVRGLKPSSAVVAVSACEVAPHAGAWIETLSSYYTTITSKCRTPRGCVD